MAAVNWRIEHFNDLDKTGTPDNVIKAFSKPSVTVSAGDGKDSFRFEVKSNAPSFSEIDMQDKVVIKREANSTQFGPDSVLMTGAVNKANKRLDTSKSIVKVKGNNYSKTLTDATAFADVQNVRVDEAIKEALTSIREYADKFAVSWHPNNPSTKEIPPNEGDEYPVVGEEWYDVPMRKVMEDMTKAKYTEDGDYYWYVDKDNQLVWRPEGSQVNDVLDESLPYHTARRKRNTEDVVNFVKVKGGTLPTGGAVEAQAINFGSAGKNGLRYKALQGNQNYVDNMHDDTMNAIGANEDTTRPSNVSGFTYPLTVGPVAQQTQSSIDNDGDYFRALKTVAKNKLRKEGEQYIENFKKGYYVIRLEVPSYRNTFNLGELYQNQISGLPSGTFRVRKIQYNAAVDVVTLREDDPSVSG